MTTLRELVHTVFPDADDKEVDYLLWSRTGYPSFWNTDNPAKEIVDSLTEYKEALKLGVPLCEFCCQPARAGTWTCEECSKMMERQP